MSARVALRSVATKSDNLTLFVERAVICLSAFRIAAPRGHQGCSLHANVVAESDTLLSALESDEQTAEDAAKVK
jgi:hypothetical protein